MTIKSSFRFERINKLKSTATLLLLKESAKIAGIVNKVYQIQWHEKFSLFVI